MKLPNPAVMRLLTRAYFMLYPVGDKLAKYCYSSHLPALHQWRAVSGLSPRRCIPDARGGELFI
jgi:hypothetical protein